MNHKTIYTDFCQNRGDVPVFSQPWYLDIVSEGKWDIALSIEKNEIVAAWPYYVSKKYGFKKVGMPPQTPFLGPFFLNEPYQSQYKSYSYKYKILEHLEKQIPDAHFVRFNFNPNIHTWYPLYRCGYSQTTRYTYVIAANQREEELKVHMRKQLRSVVCKEVHEKFIQNSKDVEKLLKMVQNKYKENRITPFFDRSIMSKIINESLSKDQGKIWIYVDENEETIGTIFTIEDDKKAYLLYTANNKKGMKREAVACLIWQSIKDTISRGKDFDFEGSMIYGVERFFRGFGGKQIPYHQITKIQHPLLKAFFAFR